ncbi:LOW QUALITY PROTEIN: DNA mismatch repair protein MutS [Geomicrobium sp. JCM 19038]|nr:LOW QUALITY PROTEIN: DNA mismatch repair protein MutS [Geomicrobium sp. JCM 19038]
MRFLFFRLGDFYELFHEDAIQAAQLLEITLTKRGKGDDAIPMCGVPYHSAESYIDKIIEKGYKIAVCEQVEDPREAKGVVKRDVVRVITPGTVMEGRALSAEENHYIAALSFHKDKIAYAKSDLTTGETEAGIVTDELVELERVLFIDGMKELIVSHDYPGDLKSWLKAVPFTVSFDDQDTIPEPLQSLYDGQDEAIEKAVGRVWSYLSETQKRSLDHLQPVTVRMSQQFMQMDAHTRRNLELTSSLIDRTKKVTLFGLLDETKTAMGSRRLRRWIESPLYHQQAIERRWNLNKLKDEMLERVNIQDALQNVYDLERLVGKVAYGNVNARELVQLKRSLQQAPSIFEAVNKLGIEGRAVTKEAELCEALADHLQNALVDEPPISTKDGGMIRKGFHEQLDEYREANENGKTWLSNLEREEREKSSIKTLKIGYNRVFGYYLEVSRGQSHLVPDYFERKQTLTNAERYVTPELKDMERKILDAQEKMEVLEYDLFVQIRETTKAQITKIQQLAKVISYIDVLQGFAVVSENRRFTRPTFTDDRTLNLVNSRHPVVEVTIPAGDYVANDVHLHEEREMLLITGPNMAGKSTYMRQVAIISIMAQIGCYVPCDTAQLPRFDRIFTRIGAADDLVSGQSTFMVEMVETEYALNQATNNSLILLDEIGRGTSTYDGMALAQAIIEFIHERVRAKTLFSTHYHELTVLEEELETLDNVHVKAEEEDGNVVFLHRVEAGRADKSYGIHVAKLASLPTEVTDRAETLLRTYESEQPTAPVQERTEPMPDEQLTLFEEPKRAEKVKEPKPTTDRELAQLKEELQQLDVLHLTPFEALEKLYEWQRKLR